MPLNYLVAYHSGNSSSHFWVDTDDFFFHVFVLFKCYVISRSYVYFYLQKKLLSLVVLLLILQTAPSFDCCSWIESTIPALSEGLFPHNLLNIENYQYFNKILFTKY